jgi:formylglycine-generating enzyme required for sulfatase activity
MSLRTSPPGAEVLVQDYRTPGEPWKSLGRTPLEDFPMPFGMLRWRIEKQGFEPLDATFAPGPLSRSVEYTLDAQGTIPPGMVRVAGGPFAFRNHPPVELDDFWLDRYEVTNRAFKEFVDGGGYARAAYWKQPFVKDGRTLTWSEAMPLFHDATGRPGPATWELGAYPDGQGAFPVGGISWFEAAAYAEFAQKALPTFYHWFKATDLGRGFNFADIVDLSNFGGKGPVAVGSLAGTSPYGSSDMAGNAREWCATRSARGQYILGGSWNEPAHSYIGEDESSPWSRLPVNGFRCARYTKAVPDLPPPVEWGWRNYAGAKPASGRGVPELPELLRVRPHRPPCHGRLRGGDRALAPRGDLLRRRPTATSACPRTSSCPATPGRRTRRSCSTRRAPPPSTRRATASRPATSTTSSAAGARSSTPSTRGPTSDGRAATRRGRTRTAT